MTCILAIETILFIDLGTSRAPALPKLVGDLVRRKSFRNLGVCKMIDKIDRFARTRH
jgi:hypothetical protein